MTKAIGAKLPKRNTAIAYTSRGVERGRKGQLDRAIADHTHAIKLDPNLSEAFYNRGNAHRDKGGELASSESGALKKPPDVY